MIKPRKGPALLACVLYGLGLPALSLAAGPGPVRVSGEGSLSSDRTAPLTLGDLEQMALQRNPTLAQAAAQVEAARARTLQSGLYPNPTVGYTGERIGAAGTAGELQGLFIDQVIVTAGKLQLNRAKFAQEVSQ